MSVIASKNIKFARLFMGVVVHNLNYSKCKGAASAVIDGYRAFNFILKRKSGEVLQIALFPSFTAYALFNDRVYKYPVVCNFSLARFKSSGATSTIGPVQPIPLDA